MKKSFIAVLILLLLVALEAVALHLKAKNPEPTAFALDTQEYALPVKAIKVSPFVFETNFVEAADKALNDVQFVIENSFARRLTQSVKQMISQQEMEALRKREQQRRLDEFRQAMAAESVEINGIYLGDNMCEIDGVKGICANGVYTLGEHCIACFDGVCAGTKCAKNSKEEQAEIVENPADEVEKNGDEVIEAKKVAAESSEPEPVTESAPQSDDLSEILHNAVETSTADEVVAAPQEEVAADETEEVVAEKTAEIAEPQEEVVGEKTAEAVETVDTAPESLQPETATAPAEPEIQPVEEEKAVKEEKAAEEKAPEVAKPENEPKAEPVAILAEEKSANKTSDEKKALVAVVIDDVGLSVPFTNQMANIKYPVTVSFLPYGMSNKKQVMQLKNAGLEVMLHVPMMPRVPADLAPVTLSPKMSKAEIQEKLRTMMDRFEGTGMQGINNHMGSAFTENREALAAVMEILKEKKMFFMDSMTTSKSVGRSVSREYGVPFVARDVFLDNERNYNYIMGQFRETERVAKKKGYAIAIGHPYPQTLQALRDWLKQTEERNIKIVPLSFLVNKLN